MEEKTEEMLDKNMYFFRRHVYAQGYLVFIVSIMVLLASFFLVNGFKHDILLMIGVFIMGYSFGLWDLVIRLYRFDEYMKYVNEKRDRHEKTLI